MTKDDNYFRQSGLKQIKLLRKHFHITGNNDNVVITKEITPTNITDFYKEYFTRVRPQFPKTLSDDKLLPAPNKNLLRGLYTGVPDANIVLNSIVRHCLYVDQILITDPFPWPTTMRHEHNVLKYPEKWISDLANKALYLCALEPWIEQDIIVVLPPSAYYRPQLSQLTQGIKIQTTDVQRAEFEHRQLLYLLVLSEPGARDSLFDVLEKMGRNFIDEERSNLLLEAEQYERDNPIRFRLPQKFIERNFPKSDTYSELTSTGGGTSFPLAMLIASLIKSFLIFDSKLSYDLLCQNFIRPANKSVEFQEQLSLAFQQMQFPFLSGVSSKKTLELRNKGYLKSFRVYLRHLWSTINNTSQSDSLDAKIFDFTDQLEVEYKNLENEWHQIRMELVQSATLSGIVTGAGLYVIAATGDVNVASLIGVGSIGIGRLRINQGLPGLSQRFQETRQSPLSVLLNLAH